MKFTPVDNQLVMHLNIIYSGLSGFYLPKTTAKQSMLDESNHGILKGSCVI